MGVPKSYSSADKTSPHSPLIWRKPELKRKTNMTPQVREIEQTPIAAPSTAAVKAAFNVLQETKPVV